MAAKKSVSAKSSKAAARSTGSKSRGAKAQTAGEKLITIDRRRREQRPEAERTGGDQAAAPQAPVATLERRKKVQRRRQIDPTTCERDYSIEEVEFMNAMDEYKRKSGRMFPTCSEVLEVIRDLGYVRRTPSEAAMSNLETMVSQRLDAASIAVDDLVGDR